MRFAIAFANGLDEGLDDLACDFWPSVGFVGKTQGCLYGAGTGRFLFTRQGA